MTNIHEIKFVDNAARVALYQYDTGQVIQFEDDFPVGTEVQFDDGKVRLIIDNQIRIPNSMLTDIGSRSAWVQEIGSDSETTRKKIVFAIKYREPKEDYVDPEEEPTFREQIQELVKANMDAFEESVEIVNQYRAEAEQSAEQSANSAEQSATSADNAGASAEDAETARDEAVDAKNKAKAYADSMTGSVQIAVASANTVKDYERSARDHATNAATSAQDASVAKGQAETAAASAKSNADIASASAASAQRNADDIKGEYDKIVSTGENYKNDLSGIRSGALADVERARTSALTDINAESEKAEEAIRNKAASAETAIEEKTDEQLERIPEVAELKQDIANHNRRITELEEGKNVYLVVTDGKVCFKYEED